MYSEKSRQMATRLAERIGTNDEKAYTMMLMTAILMDLCPDDDEIENKVIREWESCASQTRHVDIRKS